MNKQQELLLKEFEKKWQQTPGTGFLKPTLHIDDVIELIGKMTEEAYKMGHASAVEDYENNFELKPKY